MNHNSEFPIYLPVKIGDLKNHSDYVTPKTLVLDVIEKFKKVPGLPGILILNNKKYVGMLPRNKCHELLSRPYGTEVFLKRNVLSFYNQLKIQPSVISSELSIDKGVEFALSRMKDQLYDPFVVEYPNEKLRVLDMHVLLLAQTSSFKNANKIIQQQVRISRLLSSSLNITTLSKLIINYLKEIIRTDQAFLYLIEDNYHWCTSIQNEGSPITSSMISYFISKNNVDKKFQKSKKRVAVNNNSKMDDLFWPDDILKTISLVLLPIIHTDKLLGFLALVRDRRNGNNNYLGNGIDEKLINRPNACFHVFSDEEISYLSSFTSTISVAIRNAQLYKKTQELAYRDDLTKLYNRRGFYNIAQNELDNVLENQRSLTALMIDIDHFKNVNDKHGHIIGDYVLRELSNEYKDNLRDRDLICRYGGEEFFVLLPDTGLSIAHTIAKRLQKIISEKTILYDDIEINVSVSIGVAEFYPEWETIDKLIYYADQALYIAKNRGRNQVVIWNPLLSPQEYSIAYNHSKVNGNNNIILNGQRHNIDKVYDDMVEGWVSTLELRDKETEGHAHRVTNMTTELAKLIGLNDEELIHIRRGALLHDIGKIAIPDRILFKPGPLTEDEWKIMRKHPVYAKDLMMTIPFLQPAIDIPYCHHERWDGKGYPHGLKRTEIPLAARIFTVTDIWDALNSDRCYRHAWKQEDVLEYLMKNKETFFDPEIIDLFIKLYSTCNLE